MTDVIKSLLKRNDTLINEFTPVRQNIWLPIARLVRPLRNELSGVRPNGERRDIEVYDGTGINANSNLTGGLFGTFINPSDAWFSYAPLEERLKESLRVQRWCEIETAETLKTATPAYSAFYTNVVSFLLDTGAFGNAVFYQAEKKDLSGFIDKCIPLSEATWDVGPDGDVDTLFRRYTQPGHVAAREFKGQLHQNTLNRIERNPDHPVEIMHAVLPAEEDIARELFKGTIAKPYVSIYAEVQENHRISTGGYWEFPYHVERWEVGAGEKIGRGPGELALADVKTANTAQRDNLRAGNLAGNPPWGAPEEGVVPKIRLAPGKLSYGAVSMQGKELLKPLLQGANLPWSVDMAERVKEAVKEFFYYQILQLVGRTGISVEEVLEIKAERMRLLAPYGVRIQNDFLCPWALRRFKMRQRMGLVTPPPPELQQRPIQVTFTSPFALAQKSAAATSTLRVAGAVGEMMKIDPNVQDRFNGDEAIKVVNEGLGAPARVLFNDDDTLARRQARQQVQAAAANAQIADVGAGAAQKGAGAIAAIRQATQQAA